MIPQELEEWLSSIRTPLTEVRRRAEQAVRNLCDQHGYAYAGRSKDDSSLAEKLETGRIRRLEEIDDLFGCSVIIPNLAHEGAVLERLASIFVQHNLKRRGQTQKSPEVFRFDASRFIGRLNISEIEDSRLGEILFEIQVRTAFEHAWSVATHTPAYKGARIDWKLERLASQMKALVEQLDSLAVAYDQAAGVLVEHPYRQTECEAQVLSIYQKLFEDGLIPRECEPVRWGLFAKNIVSLAEAADFGKRIYLEERVAIVTAAIDLELRRLDDRSKYPLSLSVYQFTLGFLIQLKTILSGFRDWYFPPVSATLESLFPRVRSVTPRCSLKLPTPPSPDSE